ncbi:hypothetical protein BSLG_004688 [Batrachochytrium salamandrivorans]|nr:hypothetical protein BSLG_004688 [Batrachochytrium salamandrivorans]
MYYTVLSIGACANGVAGRLNYRQRCIQSLISLQSHQRYSDRISFVRHANTWPTIVRVGLSRAIPKLASYSSSTHFTSSATLPSILIESGEQPVPIVTAKSLSALAQHAMSLLDHPAVATMTSANQSIAQDLSPVNLSAKGISLSDSTHLDRPPHLKRVSSTTQSPSHSDTLSASSVRQLAHTLLHHVMILDAQDLNKTVSEDTIWCLTPHLLGQCVEAILALEAHALGESDATTKTTFGLHMHRSETIHGIPILTDHQRVIEAVLCTVRARQTGPQPEHHMWRFKAYQNMLIGVDPLCYPETQFMQYKDMIAYFEWAMKAPLGPTLGPLVDLMTDCLIPSCSPNQQCQFIHKVIQQLHLYRDRVQQGTCMDTTTLLRLLPSTITKIFQRRSDEIFKKTSLQTLQRSTIEDTETACQLKAIYDDLYTLQGPLEMHSTLDVLIPVLFQGSQFKSIVWLYKQLRNELPVGPIVQNTRVGSTRQQDQTQGTPSVSYRLHSEYIRGSMQKPELSDINGGQSRLKDTLISLGKSHRRVSFSIRFLDLVVQSCAQSGHLPTSKIALRDLLAQGGQASTDTLFELISMYWRVRRVNPPLASLSHVRNLYTEYAEKQPVSEMHSALGMLVDIYSDYPKINIGSAEEIDKILERELGRGLQPTSKVYTSLVRFYAGVGDSSRVDSLFRQAMDTYRTAMQAGGAARPSLKLLVSTARAQLAHGRLEDASSILDSVSQLRFPAVVDYFNLRMEIAAASAGSLDDQTRNSAYSRVIPDPMQMASAIRKPEASLKWIDQMTLKYGIKIDLDMAAIAIDCYGLLGFASDKVIKVLAGLKLKEGDSSLRAVTCVVVRHYGRHTALLKQILQLEKSMNISNSVVGTVPKTAVVAKDEHFEARLGYF